MNSLSFHLVQKSPVRSDATGATLGNGLTSSFIYTDRNWLQSGSTGTVSGETRATGSVAVSGTEKSSQTSGTQSKATEGIGCPSTCSSSITVDGYRATGSGTALGMAQALAASLNNSAVVTAIAKNVTSGVAQVVMTSVACGGSTNYSVSCSGISPCTNMTGGSNGVTVYDSGTVSATVNGVDETVSYGNGSTATSVASSLVSAFNADPDSPVTATSSSGVVNFISKVSGSNADYSLSASSLSNNGFVFNPASFGASPSGSAMTGGTNGTMGTVVYSFASTYAPNGDVLTGNDSVNGNWAYTYDDFNRLNGAACSAHCPDGLNTQGFSYVYDRFANLTQKNVTAGTGPMLTLSFSIGNNNRIDTYSYDPSGDLLNDGVHSYAYDAEGRIISVDGGTTASYVYDAHGLRVQKTTATGSSNYSFDLAGHQVAELTSAGWLRGEVYAGGWHLATYFNSTTYFNHADPLGTERARSSATGSSCETVVSLPFGDGQVISGVCGDPSTMHFTGKVRDSESNLDQFGARYYGSGLGRFMSADWAAKPTAVPYAAFGNPQSLNLYGYVGDNPLLHFDPDGHCWPIGACAEIVMAKVNQAQQWAQNKAIATGSPTLAATVTFTTGVTRDVVNSVVSIGTMGSATGTCLGGAGCTGGQLAKALVGDGLKAAAIAAPALGALGTGGVVASDTLGAGELAAPEIDAGATQLNKVYRVWGGESGPNGSYWTPTDPSLIPDFRSAAGLPDVNSGRFVSEGILMDGNGVTFTPGGAASGAGGPGGLPEVVIPDPANQVQLTNVSGANPPF